MDKLNATVFLKVVETGSFKKTADILGYTQAGVSYIINAMEEEFGITLFHREYGGVRLTSEGSKILHFVRQIADWEHYLSEAIDDIRDLRSGSVRICTFSSVYIHWLPGIIRKYHERYPNIHVDIISCEVESEMEQKVMQREVDCAFLPDIPRGDMDYFPLMEESLMVAVPADHPMAFKSKFPRSELKNYPYIMFTFDKPDFNDLIFRGTQMPQVAFTVDNDYAAMAMVGQGLGIAIFPQILLGDMPFPIRALELDPPQRRHVNIATRSMDTCTHAAREFIRCTREWIEENGIAKAGESV